MSGPSAVIKAVCISEKKGEQKHPVDSIRLLPRHGIVGDAHAGNWHRQVSLLGTQSVARLQEKIAFPLLPGGGVYYTMNYAVQGNITSFSQQGMQTVAIAGAMAAAILLVSTAFRLASSLKAHRLEKHSR